MLNCIHFTSPVIIHLLYRDGGGAGQQRMTSSESEQPGQTWVVLEDEDGAFNVTVVLGFGE